MTKIQEIDGLSSIAPHYDGILCDAWGVIHNGVELFAGVERAMSTYRNSYGPVIILTNAPRPSSIIPAQLDRLGLARGAYDAVVTSGDATRAEILKRSGKKVFRLGPQKDDTLYEGTQISFTRLEDADYIICTGLVDDQSEAPEDYRPMLRQAAGRALPMICVNPDIVVNWGGKIIYCAGALAQIYAEEGGTVIFGGKPYAPIYDLAFSTINDIAARPIDLSRILAIGDGLGTDIKGANNAGIDVLFIAGNGGINGDISDETALDGALNEQGLYAKYMMRDLVW